MYSTGVFRPLIVTTAFLLAVSYWSRAPTRPALTTSLGGKIHWRMIVAREASAFRSTRKNSYPVVIGGSRGNGPPGTYGSCRITAFPYNSIAEDCSLARASSPPSRIQPPLRQSSQRSSSLETRIPCVVPAADSGHVSPSCSSNRLRGIDNVRCPDESTDMLEALPSSMRSPQSASRDARGGGSAELTSETDIANNMATPR